MMFFGFRVSLAGIAAMLVWSSCSSPAPKVADGSHAQEPTSQHTVRVELHYTKDSIRVVDSIQFSGDSENVGVIMKRIAEKGLVQYEASEQTGGFMNQIDGYKAGSGKFWWLCVNDTSAEVGFLNKFVRPNAKIGWYFLKGQEDGCKTCYCGWKK